MRKTLLAASLLLASLGAVAQNKGYKNPILPGFYPDPSVCRVDSDFYLVNSTFGYTPGVPVWHSRDLVNWEQIGNCITRESQLWLGMFNPQTGIYAPTIRYNDGVYYMVTTNISLQAKKYITNDPNPVKQNFIVYTTDPAGEWSEPVFLDQQGIDPSLYFEDGKCYLVSNPNDEITLCEINPKTGEQLAPSRVISKGSGGRYPEGPHIYKKDGWYYLMLAEGGTEEAHKLTMFRSKYIYGPYEPNPANPFLTHCNVLGQNNPIHGTGHGDLVQAPDGSWWLVALAYRPQGSGGTHHLLGRETFLAPVRWDENAWPVVNGNGTISLDMQVPTLPQHPFAQKPFRYDLKQKLGPEWLYLGHRVAENYLQNKNGLQLTATTENLDKNSARVTFVGHRQQHIDCTVQTQVTLKDTQAGDEAGLTTYMMFTGHYDVFVRARADKQNEVVLRYTVGNLKQDVKTVSIPAGKAVTLKIAADSDYYTYSYSLDGKKFEELGKLDTKFLSSETQGGFTGIVFGMYAQGLEGTHAKAVFPYYEYKYAE